MNQALSAYEKSTATFDGKTRAVFRRGSGPAVIVIAEIPGITPRVIEFADRVVDLGCTAVLPHLFGEPGKDPYSDGPVVLATTMLRSLGPACISREFSTWATGRTSPVISWLRALARQCHEECGGPGVGAIGMCFTGGFALGMMVEGSVKAPVLSQPSLPLPLTARHRRDPGVSPRDLELVKERCAREPDLCLLGMRFTADRYVPAERFATLKEALGDQFVAIEIDSSPANEFGIPRMAHSVVTEHLVDEAGHPTRQALDEVLAFFRTRLLPDGVS